MAVQKSKKSRSKRGTRRAHDALKGVTLTENQTTGEMHRRHHLTPNGFYRDRQVFIPKEKATEEESEA